MPFVEYDADKAIENAKQQDPEFEKLWDEGQVERYIVNEIRYLRNRKGMTQEELARKCGVHQQEISRMESQRTSPSLKKISKMLNALDCEVKIVPKANVTNVADDEPDKHDNIMDFNLIREYKPTKTILNSAAMVFSNNGGIK